MYTKLWVRISMAALLLFVNNILVLPSSGFAEEITLSGESTGESIPSWARMCGSFTYPEDIWAETTTSLWVSDFYSGFHHYDGQTWSSLPTAPISYASSIWGQEGVLYAVRGDQPQIYRYTGAQWEMAFEHANSDFNFVAICGTALDDIWAIGELGEAGHVFHYDGQDWEDVHTLMVSGLGTINPKDIWISPEGNVYIVGQLSSMGGGLSSYVDGVWTDSKVSNAIGDGSGVLYGVSGSSDDDILVVGESATVIHYDGERWVQISVPEGVTSNFFCVWAGASDHAYIGSSSQLFFWDGQTVQTVSSVSLGTRHIIGVDKSHIYLTSIRSGYTGIWAQAQPQFLIDDVEGTVGQSITIPVELNTNGYETFSAYLELSFDPANVISITSIYPAEALTDWLFDCSLASASPARIVMAGGSPLPEASTIFNIEATLVGSTGESTQLVGLEARAAGYDAIVQPGTIDIVDVLSASFTSSSSEGIAPTTIEFTNTSAGSITSYLWDFGDGSTSTEANPSHEFTEAGTFTVELTITGAGGIANTSETVTIYKTVVADFSHNVSSGLVPLEISFTNASIGSYDELLWSFGDGETSSEIDPVHIYETVGDYAVSLTVTGPGGEDTKTIPDTIHVSYGYVTGNISDNLGNPLENVELVLTSTLDQSTFSDLSDTEGIYTIGELIQDEYVLVPSTSYPAGDSIGSADASIILRWMMDHYTLDNNQLIAADINQSGRVDEEDAADILKGWTGYAPYPFGDDPWIFLPSEEIIALSEISSVGHDFTAILLGDVSCGSGSEIQSFGDQPVELTWQFEEIEGRTVATLSLDTNNVTFYNLDMILGYDRFNIELNELIPGQDLGRSVLSMAKDQGNGQVRIAIASSSPLNSGVVYRIILSEYVREDTPLQVVYANASEGKVLVEFPEVLPEATVLFLPFMF